MTIGEIARKPLARAAVLSISFHALVLAALIQAATINPIKPPPLESLPDLILNVAMVQDQFGEGGKQLKTREESRTAALSREAIVIPERTLQKAIPAEAPDPAPPPVQNTKEELNRLTFVTQNVINTMDLQALMRRSQLYSSLAEAAIRSALERSIPEKERNGYKGREALLTIRFAPDGEVSRTAVTGDEALGSALNDRLELADMPRPNDFLLGYRELRYAIKFHGRFISLETAPQ